MRTSQQPVAAPVWEGHRGGDGGAGRSGSGRSPGSLSPREASTSPAFQKWVMHNPDDCADYHYSHSGERVSCSGRAPSGSADDAFGRGQAHRFGSPHGSPQHQQQQLTARHAEIAPALGGAWFYKTGEEGGITQTRPHERWCWVGGEGRTLYWAKTACADRFVSGSIALHDVRRLELRTEAYELPGLSGRTPLHSIVVRTLSRELTLRTAKHEKFRAWHRALQLLCPNAAEVRY